MQFRIKQTIVTNLVKFRQPLEIFEMQSPVYLGVWILSITLCLQWVGSKAHDRLSCLNENGAEVDWFMGYKFPKLASEPFESGVSYAYITSQDVLGNQTDYKEWYVVRKHKDSALGLFRDKFRSLLLHYSGISTLGTSPMPTRRRRRALRSRAQVPERWSLSSLPITDPSSALLRTLKVAYTTNVSTILYNDDASGTSSIDEDDNNSDEGSPRKNENNSGKAHAKGVLMLDEHSGRGVWVTHSMPRFPESLDQPLAIPPNAQIYGQTFMCITFDLERTGKNVVEHLRIMQPQVYGARVSEKILQMLPNIQDLDKSLGREARLNTAVKLSQLITTSGGQILNLFSKSKKYQNDIYSGWIDEELHTGLDVETWRRGSGTPLNSSCPAGDYRTNNVKLLEYDDSTSWLYSKDHSKWAISEDAGRAYVCIGDSNRMASQFKRGGGAVCIKCPVCWTIFQHTIRELEPCPTGYMKTDPPNKSDPNLMERIAKMFKW